MKLVWIVIKNGILIDSFLNSLLVVRRKFKTLAVSQRNVEDFGALVNCLVHWSLSVLQLLLTEMVGVWPNLFIWINWTEAVNWLVHWRLGVYHAVVRIKGFRFEQLNLTQSTHAFGRDNTRYFILFILNAKVSIIHAKIVLFNEWSNELSNSLAIPRLHFHSSFMLLFLYFLFTRLLSRLFLGGTESPFVLKEVIHFNFNF